jgi:hypothetical protein
MQEMTRSARLRKYEIAYEECLKKIKIIQSHPIKISRSRQEQSRHIKKSRSRRSPEEQVQPIKKSRSKRSPKEQVQPTKKSRSRCCKTFIDTTNLKKSLNKSLETKKPLNLYQQFVKKESQKSIYKGVPAKERMVAISKEWNNQKTK